MKKVILIAFAAVMQAATAAPRDYSAIRGFNYTPSTATNSIDFWSDYDRVLVECELEYAKRLGLNQARVFLSYVVYEREPERFLERVRHFVKAAHARGISTMVVVWDAYCTQEMPAYDFADKRQWYPNPGPQRLGKEVWPKGEKYVRDLVTALSREPGLSFWCVMNEPFDLAKRPQLREFVIHFARLLKQLDPRTPITVGHLRPASEWGQIAHLVDVISFHGYPSTRAALLRDLAEAKRIAAEHNKPLLQTELGCIGLGNPYDMALELLQRERVGWYVWELMINRGRWGTIHGVFCGDGTVRDPSIVAALMGFYLNRTPGAIRAETNREKVATRAVASAQKRLATTEAPRERGLTLAETMASLLESGELVPVNKLASVKDCATSGGNPDEVALQEVL